MNTRPFDLPAEAAAEALSVSDLNRLVRQSLEKGFPLLRVSGELSAVSRAASGHVYFTLKDDQAQVRCAMWRNKAQLLGFRPENGMQVEARALVTLYEARGDYQLNIESLRQSGAGNIFEAFLRLKARLQAEGLFAPELKRPLPDYPRRVAIVTSPQAAALHDVLSALRRRAPGIQPVLFPAMVQGEAAPEQLCRALELIGRRAQLDRLDAVLLVRGGGSPEDLQAFNAEALARAIRACPVAVISGVGHETDFTIADFAADVRAPTPTAAAELVSAGYHAARAQLDQLQIQLQQIMQRQLHALTQRVDKAGLRLRHPAQRLSIESDRCRQLETRLHNATLRWFERKNQQLDKLDIRLQAQRPDLERLAERLERNASQLAGNTRRWLSSHATRLEHLATQLELLAPAAVLARGYSITRDASGRILRSAGQIADGDPLEIELAKGRVRARTISTDTGLQATPKPD